MKHVFCCREASSTLGVSASTIQRWCDQGLLQYEKTSGRHRRIPAAQLVRFIRSRGGRVADASVLGLPPGTGSTWLSPRDAVARLVDGLVRGDEESCRRAVFDCFLAGARVSQIGDDLIAPAFYDIGELWRQGKAEVYQERCGLEIMQRLLSEMRAFLPEATNAAPLAFGASPLGDHFCLPTTLVELVLRESGWNAMSLGISLPLMAMETAIRRHRPALFWISASYLPNPETFLDEYRHLFDQVGQDVAFVLGGKALSDAIRQRMRYATFCETLEQLEAFAGPMQRIVRRGVESCGAGLRPHRSDADGQLGAA